MIRSRLLPLLTIAVLSAGVSACGGKSDASSGGTGGKLNLVAFSTPKEAYAQLIPAFQKTPAGKGVTFSQSYGASGDQARAVIAGLPTDVVALSLEPDISKLVKEDLVAPDWNSGATKGFVSKSVVVLAVRKGNPKGIKGWDDLVKPGVQVLNPNVFTSGGARWNVMAAYGAQIKQGKSPAEAEAYLAELYKHIPVQDKAARDALQTFTSGKGDVLISYENEAITAQQKGQAIDYVIPDQTIQIENPIAVTKDSKHPTQAKAFVDWLESDDAQRIFAAKGYRPVKDALVDTKKFPTPPALFRIDDVGGWPDVMKKFFDPDNSVMQKIEKGLGVSTG